MPEVPFKGAGYTGSVDQIHITKFEIGPFPPRARLFDRAVLVRECQKFQDAARAFLVCQEWLKVPPDTQEIIPEVLPVLEPKVKKPPMEVLVWASGFALNEGLLVFKVDVRSSEKMPTKARKMIGDSLSKALKVLIGTIERTGGVPGDIVPADILVTPPRHEHVAVNSNEIPEIP